MTRFAAGDRVRVRDDWPETRGPVHIRTPHYVRGLEGTIRAHLGRYPNPEDLAFARPAPELDLYHVSFSRRAVWPDDLAEGTTPGPAGSEDEIVIEIYETWLEAA